MAGADKRDDLSDDRPLSRRLREELQLTSGPRGFVKVPEEHLSAAIGIRKAVEVIEGGGPAAHEMAEILIDIGELSGNPLGREGVAISIRQAMRELEAREACEQFWRRLVEKLSLDDRHHNKVLIKQGPTKKQVFINPAIGTNTDEIPLINLPTELANQLVRLVREKKLAFIEARFDSQLKLPRLGPEVSIEVAPADVQVSVDDSSIAKDDENNTSTGDANDGEEKMVIMGNEVPPVVQPSAHPVSNGPNTKGDVSEAKGFWMNYKSSSDKDVPIVLLGCGRSIQDPYRLLKIVGSREEGIGFVIKDPKSFSTRLTLTGAGSPLKKGR